jgi:hypothetical protein
MAMMARDGEVVASAMRDSRFPASISNQRTTQLYSVIGYLRSTDETYRGELEAQNWPEACQMALHSIPDLQLAACYRGKVELVGTLENLPTDPPVWKPADLFRQSQVITVIGFTDAGDAETLHAYTAANWVLAAHEAIRLHGNDLSWRFIAAVSGMQSPVGLWTRLKEAYLGSDQQTDGDDARVELKEDAGHDTASKPAAGRGIS